MKLRKIGTIAAAVLILASMAVSAYAVPPGSGKNDRAAEARAAVEVDGTAAVPGNAERTEETVVIARKGPGGKITARFIGEDGIPREVTLRPGEDKVTFSLPGEKTTSSFVYNGETVSGGAGGIAAETAKTGRYTVTTSQVG